MKIERFQELAGAFGGDLSRWPEADQKNAALLLRASTAAQQIIDEAQALDAALDCVEIDVDDQQVERLLAAIAGRADAVPRACAPPAPIPQLSAGRSPLWPAGFLVAMGMLGVISGALTPAAPVNLSPAAVAVNAATNPSIVDLADSVGYYSTRYLVTWAQ